MCPFIPTCPFYRCYARTQDEFVQDTIDRYCHADGEGCRQRQAKEHYGTFLAVNQCPGGEYLTA
ncbi:hypothetical protein [Paucidesulfovibrio longus]|jgi:phage-related protein|uniref:hypothetical protein n=1 Tax=Paucidesulfovibrio longus TaxID=889 RepID=UPI0003B66472|nr:hypothetical protein [Paucidesulfovibrio longus]